MDEVALRRPQPMKPIIENKIRQFVLEFIDFWNRGDVDSLSAYMKPDIRLTSPLLSLVLHGNTGNEIKGREEVIEYWKKLRQVRPIVLLDIKEFKRNNQDIRLSINLKDEPMEVQVSFRYTQYGKIEELHFVYLPVS